MNSWSLYRAPRRWHITLARPAGRVARKRFAVIHSAAGRGDDAGPLLPRHRRGVYRGRRITARSVSVRAPWSPRRTPYSLCRTHRRAQLCLPVGARLSGRGRAALDPARRCIALTTPPCAFANCLRRSSMAPGRSVGSPGPSPAAGPAAPRQLPNRGEPATPRGLARSGRRPNSITEPYDWVRSGCGGE